MGRKGLGKLAGFGIAEVVEVRTVKDRWLTHFRMDFLKMTASGRAPLIQPYEPEILADKRTSEKPGTLITLTRLLVQRSVDRDLFRMSMARRFAVLSGGFKVAVNGELLKREETPLQFRYPSTGRNTEDVPGVGPIQWWMGFTEKPIPVDNARGIAVLARGRMAQTPFFFDLSGGAHGQHGMQYMTGEVVADQLDAAEDFVATDRQGVVWTEPMPAALLAWGEAKVRELLAEWVDSRTDANKQRLQEIVDRLDQTVEQRIGRLQPGEQAEARQVVHKLASIPTIVDEPDRARELLDLVLRAFEDSSFFALIRALGSTDRAARDEVMRLVTELDIFETVKMAEVVRARVGVIRKFREMIAADVAEKPDMQDFLFTHPWLIDPEWNVVEHETRLETLLVEKFGLDRNADEDSDKRVDFFCIGTRGRYLVVEVKRPSKSLGQKEITQIINYVGYLRDHAPATEGAPNYYSGVLVGHSVTPDGRRWATTAQKDGITVRSWEELLDVAERIHRDFLNVIRGRAPGDDPRVRSLAIDADPSRP
jgi:hypothetical protein